jgi:hypothetical protein
MGILIPFSFAGVGYYLIEAQESKVVGRFWVQVSEIALLLECLTRIGWYPRASSLAVRDSSCVAGECSSIFSCI